jgi:hypothetical protein
MRVRARVNRIIDTGIIIISYVPVVLYVYACVLRGTNINNTHNRSCHD